MMKFIKKIEENGIPDKVLNNTFMRVFKDAYHSSSLDDIIPKITYFEFLNKLKELKELKNKIRTLSY